MFGVSALPFHTPKALRLHEPVLLRHLLVCAHSTFPEFVVGRSALSSHVESFRSRLLALSLRLLMHVFACAPSPPQSYPKCTPPSSSLLLSECRSSSDPSILKHTPCQVVSPFVNVACILQPLPAFPVYDPFFTSSKLRTLSPKTDV